MGDEHDSWLSGIGVDVESVLSSAVKDVQDAGSAVADVASSTITEAVDGAKGILADVANQVSDSSAAAYILPAAQNVIKQARQSAGIANSFAPRPLTDDEMADATAIFGASIDYSKVLVDGGSLAAAGSSRTTGNTIHLTDDMFVAGTSDTNTEGRRTLVHELTHVWQYQHQGWTYAPKALWAQAKAAVIDGDRNTAYDWKKLLTTPWEDWNPEAQAEAVEDYNRSLHNVLDGTATRNDYDNLALLEQYIDKLTAT